MAGKVPFPAQYQVSFFPPWHAYDKFAGPVKNDAISDVITQIYPWKHFTIEELKKGKIPLWNPYSFSGNLHLANYQTAVYSPFNLIFFVLPFLDAWSIVILLQPLIAGLGMWLFLRELKLTSFSTALGAITYMFCGFIVAWMPWGTLSMVAAFLPWSLFAIEKGYKKNSFFINFLLTISLAFAFFSGHFQVGLYVALYTIAYLVFRGWVSKDRKVFLRQLLFYCIGIGISLIQILPTLDLYQSSVRSQLFTNNAGGIPFTYLVTLFAPDFYGNPVTRNDWLGYYGERAGFIGIVPFLLAFYAPFSIKNRAFVIFFFLAGCISVAFSLDSPLQNLLSLTKIPVFSTSIPSRIIVLFSFSFAVLAAIGLDHLAQNGRKIKLRNLFIPLYIVSTSLLIIWGILLFTNTLPVDKAILAKRNFLLPSVIFFISTIAILGSALLKKKVLFLFLLPLFFLLLVSFDSLRFVSKWMSFDPRDKVYPEVPVITAMQSLIGQGRVYGDFGSSIDTYYRLPSINGYDPLYLQRYGEFIQSATTGNWEPAGKSVVSLSKRGKYTDRVLDLLGVTIIYHPVSYNGQSWAFPVWENPEKYSAIYGDDRFQLFKNKTAFPRAKLFYKYLVKKEEHEIIKTFYDDNFDYKNVLVLEEDPRLPENSRSGKGRAQIISMEPTRIHIKVSSSTPALLFLSDTYYPAWKAKVNGREEKIYRTDYSFRSVKVPKGESEVEFYLDNFFFF